MDFPNLLLEIHMALHFLVIATLFLDKDRAQSFEIIKIIIKILKYLK